MMKRFTRRAAASALLLMAGLVSGAAAAQENASGLVLSNVTTEVTAGTEQTNAAGLRVRARSVPYSTDEQTNAADLTLKPGPPEPAVIVDQADPADVWMMF